MLVLHFQQGSAGRHQGLGQVSVSVQPRPRTSLRCGASHAMALGAALSRPKRFILVLMFRAGKEAVATCRCSSCSVTKVYLESCTCLKSLRASSVYK